MADTKTVYLLHPLNGLTPFTPEHAERLMAIPERDRGGWAYPPKETNESANNSAAKGRTKRKSKGEARDDS